jgi:hypothetical protein
MTSNAINLANLLSPGTSNVTSSAVAGISGIFVDSYALPSDLPTAGNAFGEQAYVSSSNKLFFWNGLGWFDIALTNNPPVLSGFVDSVNWHEDWAVASDSRTYKTITGTATDSEGLPLTWSSRLDSLYGFGDPTNICAVSGTDGTYVITPNSNSVAGKFNLVIIVNDGPHNFEKSIEIDLDFGPVPGGQLFTSSATWTAPTGVTLVHAVCVGAGAESGTIAGGGGGLGWKNNIPVVPGQSYSVVVGSGGQNKADEHSYFISQATVMGRGGNGSSGGSWVGDGGGNGGNGQGSGTYNECGGGGAGGYTGNGGNGKSGTTGQAGNGSGGGGGGSMANSGGYTCGGGGVGMYGQGANGVGGLAGIHPNQHPTTTSAGTGGSGGGNALSTYGHADAADYGGGGGGGGSGAGGGNSGSGAVRIVWGGGHGDRSFPTKNVDSAFSSSNGGGGE